MRISDWSSDVCSSYLNRVVVRCREADWQSPWCGDRRIAMTGATPLPPLRPLALYAIGLGSNRRHVRFGDPRRVLLAALAAIEGDDIEAVDASPIVASDPLGPSRRRYANAVALVASSLDPPAMLDRLQAIEAAFGRRTGQRWSARTLDLDNLLW